MFDNSINLDKTKSEITRLIKTQFKSLHCCQQEIELKEISKEEVDLIPIADQEASKVRTSCIDTKEETKRLDKPILLTKHDVNTKSRWVEIETIEIGGMLNNFNFYSNQRDKNREVMNDSQIGFIQTYP